MKKELAKKIRMKVMKQRINNTYGCMAAVTIDPDEFKRLHKMDWNNSNYDYYKETSVRSDGEGAIFKAPFKKKITMLRKDGSKDTRANFMGIAIPSVIVVIVKSPYVYGNDILGIETQDGERIGQFHAESILEHYKVPDSVLEEWQVREEEFTNGI